MTAAKHLRNNDASVRNYDSLGNKFPHETGILILSGVLTSYVFSSLGLDDKRKPGTLRSLFPLILPSVDCFFFRKLVFLRSPAQ
ncbi:unnamed protein product [Ixodes pacificus]